MLPEWLQFDDPLVRRILYGAAVFVAIVIVVRVLSGWSERRRSAARRAELQRDYDKVRLQQEEIRKLAGRIEATSSTNRIAGFAIVRQIETVFSEGRPSSVTAVELVKAMAAQRGANALINLQTQQAPNGKWYASGDAVIVKVFGRKDREPPAHKSGE